MDAVSENVFRLRLGERVSAGGDVSDLQVSGVSRRALGPTLFVARRPGVIVVHGQMQTGASVELVSSLGGSITRFVAPGLHAFKFLIEPQPDESWCPNDDGAPPHVFSKGDRSCSSCGAPIQHG